MTPYRAILTACLALLLSSCATTPVLTEKNADIAREIRQDAPAVGRVAISPDGRYALSGGMSTFILWDILHGKKLGTYKHQKGLLSPVDVAFSPDGNHFASGGIGTKLWSLKTGTEVMTFDEEQAEAVAFSPDGRFLLSGNPELTFSPFIKEKDPRLKIFSVSTGEEIKDFKLKQPERFQCVAYSPDGKYVLSGDTTGELKLWNVATGKAIRTVKAVSGFVKVVRAVAFSKNGQYALSGGSDNSVILWNAKNLSEIKRFVGHTAFGGISSVAFSPDGKYVLSSEWNGTIKIWDLASGSEQKMFSGNIVNTQAGTAAKFFPNGKFVISAGDASTRIWDAATGKEVASMIAFEDGEWIVTTANGYYVASPKGDQYLKVKVGGQEYNIETLREAFYRPDLVRLALSGGSLQELNNIADITPPPAVAIVDTPGRVDAGDAVVTLKISDAGGGIGDIRIYLNGSAVVQDSTRSVEVVPAGPNTIYKKYNLKLSNGSNAIRAVAFNADNTMQSADAVFKIAAQIKSDDKPSLHALVIGINAYKNPKLQLNYAAADAALFADTLKAIALPLFEKVKIKTLSSIEETTRENILRELRAQQSIKPDDLFVLYIASHGTVDDGEYFLITSNVGSLRTEKLKTDALSQDMLKGAIANIPATKKLIVIDTCNAGALGEQIQQALLTRGMSEDTALKILSRAVGSTILSASTSVQEALEGYQGHGLFTYVLAEGLKGGADRGKTGYIRTTELADYVDNEVPPLAEKVFQRAQYPTISISGQAFPIGKVR